jgi:hypothetical protein
LCDRNKEGSHLRLAAENKSQKSEIFSAPEKCGLRTTFSPQLHHKKPSKNHVLQTVFRKIPLEKHAFTTARKNRKN